MNTLEYLSNPDLRGLYWPAVVCGLAIAVLCGALSVLVSLKRMAFVGQGISHAAFGGVGLSVLAVPALLGAAPGLAGAAMPLHYAIVFLFCLGAALLVGWLAERGKTEADTAIGIVLVVSMAAGAVMIRAAESAASWESFLFGDILSVEWSDAAFAWGAALVTLTALWLARRPMVFWAFDPAAAAAWGVRCTGMSLLLLALLALATVVAMKLAGVILATAMLVLPGAAALKLSRRGGVVLGLAGVCSLLGVVGGLVVSFELDWPAGASIVCVLAVLFAASAVAGLVGGRRAKAAG